MKKGPQLTVIQGGGEKTNREREDLKTPRRRKLRAVGTTMLTTFHGQIHVRVEKTNLTSKEIKQIENAVTIFLCCCNKILAINAIFRTVEMTAAAIANLGNRNAVKEFKSIGVHVLDLKMSKQDLIEQATSLLQQMKKLGVSYLEAGTSKMHKGTPGELFERNCKL